MLGATFSLIDMPSRHDRLTPSSSRRNNVAKLLYLFTLGERTHFGQIECLKLLASPRFADKRLGYLGTMLLLDENQEVLTLVTNSLSNDLKHPNQYVVGLALCTLGNIASVEMARDLFPEIENLVSTSNPYVRRKAALCAMRICRKVPDLQEHFLEKAKVLLNDRNHGVLLCGLTLVTSLCEAEESEGAVEDVVEMFKPLTGPLVKVLKSLASSGYAPEHDVTGIADPFLQVKILRLLRVLGRGDAEVSEQINDILAQVASNTDASKNVGNAILYETVLTILSIEADSGLRVLGVNILGKFLANKDNNIRYVALNTLVRVVAVEPNAVQRHRNTILDCLRDPDISIRRRALDLAFTLINDSNTKVLVRELLAFLEVADAEFKPTMTLQIGLAAERFAPDKRWHVDTMLRVLTLAGNYVKEELLSSFIRLIATSPELQSYAVQKLHANLASDITQEGLCLAGAWVIGEYGELLLKGGQHDGEDVVKPVSEDDVVELFNTILNSAYGTPLVTQYIITAATKLSTRFTQPASIERLRRLLRANQANLDVEIQQRAVEYSALFEHDAIRRGVLEKMPPPEPREDVLKTSDPGAAAKRRTIKPGGAASKTAVKTVEQDLLDLMGEDVDMNSGAAPPPTLNGTGRGNADLLADILGGSDTMSSGPTASVPPLANQNTTTSASADILSLFDTPSPAPTTSVSTAAPRAAPTAPPPTTEHLAYNAHGLRLTISTRRDATAAQATARFRNTGTGDISRVSLQVAVPKTQRLQLQALGNELLQPGAEAQQGMRVVAAAGGVSDFPFRCCI